MIHSTGKSCLSIMWQRQPAWYEWIRNYVKFNESTSVPKLSEILQPILTFIMVILIHVLWFISTKIIITSWIFMKCTALSLAEGNFWSTVREVLVATYYFQKCYWSVLEVFWGFQNIVWFNSCYIYPICITCVLIFIY